MTELSPQAQEVFWAFNRAASGKPDDWHYLPSIAAALRAAAEQVIPKPNDWDRDKLSERELQLLRFVRAEIFAIADELQAQ